MKENMSSINPDSHLIELELKITGQYLAYALGYYYPREGIGSHSRWSNCILCLKNNHKENAEAIAKYSWDIVMNRIKYDCVLRALSHDEVAINTNSRKGIDIMGKWLSRKCNAAYRPDLLKKIKSVDTMKGYSYEDKLRILNEVYDCEESGYQRYLVIDDVTTTGATFEVINEKICRSNLKAIVTFLAVGKTTEKRNQKQVVDWDLFNKLREYKSARCQVGEIL